MPDYDFSMIAPHSLPYGPLGVIMRGNQYFHQRTDGYTIPFEYGPLLGSIAGFYITLAKSPPFILMDCFYGAMLGFLLVTGYNLLVLGSQTKQPIPHERPTVENIMAMYRELHLDHLRYDKAAKDKQDNGPIFLRTRSRMRSRSH
jgi:hypothetical protein